MREANEQNSNPTDYAGGERSNVRLWRGRGTHNHATINAILDEALFATIGYAIDGQPFATPTQIWRVDDWIYWHGSAGSRMLLALKEGPDVCVSAYIVDGLVLSRLASAHSINYRSVMAFGRPEPVADDAEKLAQMRRYFDRLYPGRWDETIVPDLRDMRRIIMVRMRIEEATAKIRKGPPGDGEALFSQPAWAGVLPIERAVGRPVAGPRLKRGIEEPRYLGDFAERLRFGRVAENAQDRTSVEAAVVAVRDLTPDIRAFRLAFEAIPEPQPGAHIKVQVVRDDGTLDWRDYSIVNAGAKAGFIEIAVKREDQGTGGSRYLHTQIAVGDELRVTAPISDFALPAEARRVHLIAAGIGITPILPMARALAARGTPFELHYAGRSHAKMAYLDEARAAAGAHLTLHVTNGDSRKRLDPVAIVARYEVGDAICVCGPQTLVEATLAAGIAAGYPREAIRFELFGAQQAGSRAPDKPVQVHLQRTGITLDVPAGTSILTAVLAAGIEVPHSCKRGECKTCACRVLAGEPDHRDAVLSREERQHKMCICVSRGKTPELTLDL